MQNINVKEAYTYTKDLNVLYAEDDLSLQSQTEKIFKLLFNSVVCANDGQEALDIYKKKDFDIVITDVLMPNMDGLEFSKQIKKINPNQCIVVISAHNDNEQLFEFININISKYLRKPIIMDNILTILSNASKNIINERMVEKYRKDIEEKNQSLKIKRNQCDVMMNIIDLKLSQLSKEAPLQPSANPSINKKDLNALNDLINDIDGIASMMNLQKSSIDSKIETLSDLFIDYSNILSQYTDYDGLSSSLKELGSSMKNDSNKFIEKLDENLVLLMSIIYVLKLLISFLEDDNIERALRLQTSVIYDIKSILK